jgi:hypothetical protein
MKFWGISIVFFGASLLAAVPKPTNDTFYPSKMTMTNGSSAPAAYRKDLAVDTQEACRTVHRALYLIENHMPQIKAYFKDGINFKVLFANETFYRKHLTARYQACTRTGVPFYRYGRCGTQQETLAFVRVTLGWVHSTINLCDEFFAASSWERQSVLVHEFGRLEDIGDDSNFSTNNIYVWDAITSKLADAKTFDALSKP